MGPFATLAISTIKLKNDSNFRSASLSNCWFPKCLLKVVCVFNDAFSAGKQLPLLPDMHDDNEGNSFNTAEAISAISALFVFPARSIWDFDKSAIFASNFDASPAISAAVAPSDSILSTPFTLEDSASTDARSALFLETKSAISKA